MKNFKACMIMMLLGLCVAIILSKNADADGTGNYPAPENGDWTIENETIVWNETIILTGNLTIEKYGNLTLNNVTLIMNCSFDGEFIIEIKNGSILGIFDFDNNSLTINDRSNITSKNNSYEYKFFVNSGADFVMRNSELSECGYKFSGDDGSTGLTIKTNNTIIENSSFFRNYYGIYFKESNNNIVQNNIMFENQYGISIDSSCNNKIIDNHFFLNHYGIYLSYHSENNLINNNTFFNNSDIGIYCTLYSDNNIIINNILFNNSIGIYLFFYSENNKIINNNFFKNNISISLLASDDNQIVNSTISESFEYDIYFKSRSELTLINTTVDKKNIYFEDGDSELRVKWYLKVIVKNQYLEQFSNVKINIRNNGGFTETHFTDSKGWVKWIELLEYIEGKNDRIYFSPYTINVSKNNEKNVTNIIINNSKTIELVLLETIVNLTIKNLTGTSVNIIWETYEESDSLVKYGLNNNYGFNESNKKMTKNHNITFTNLISETKYHFCVISTDKYNNSNQSDDYIFTTLDITSPEILNIEIVSITQTSAIIEWKTNERSDSLIKYGLNESYDYEEFNNNFVIYHELELVGLITNTTYHFCIISTDESFNSNQTKDFTFKTRKPPDKIPPEITNISVVSITHNSAIIQWETNENSTSVVEYGLNDTYKKIIFKSNLVIQHSIELLWLNSNTTYHLFVKSTDESDNSNQSKDFTFKTLEPPDTTPPEIYEIKIYNNTQTSVVIEWKTNEISDSLIKYSRSLSLNKELYNAGLTKFHSVNITDLEPNNTYYFCIYSTDAYDNKNSSSLINFNTLPPLLKNLNVFITLFNDFFLSNSINNKINITISNSTTLLGGVNLDFGTIIDGKIEKKDKNKKTDINGNYIVFYDPSFVNEDTEIIFWVNASFAGYHFNNDTKKEIWIRVIKISKIEIEGSFPNKTKISAVAKYIGKGLEIKGVTNPGPTDYKNIDIFIEVKFTGFVLYWINISVIYKEDLLPKNIFEENLRIYMWDEKEEKWESIKESVVNKNENFIWANITHLTIFAPRDELAEEPNFDKYPILEITDISLSNVNPKEGENIAINAKIHNKGKGIGENIKVTYYVDDLLIGTISIDSLLPDESKIVTINWTATKGKYIIKIKVENEQKEKIENTKEVIVKEEKSELSTVYGLIVLLIILIFILIIISNLPNEDFEIKKDKVGFEKNETKEEKSQNIEKKSKNEMNEEEIINGGVEKNE